MTNTFQYCNTKNYLCRLQCQYQPHTIKKMTYYKWWTGNNQEAMKAHLKVPFWHSHVPWRTFQHYLATQQPTCSKSSYFWSYPTLPSSPLQAFHVEVTLLLDAVPSWLTKILSLTSFITWHLGWWRPGWGPASLCQCHEVLGTHVI